MIRPISLRLSSLAAIVALVPLALAVEPDGMELKISRTVLTHTLVTSFPFTQGDLTATSTVEVRSHGKPVPGKRVVILARSSEGSVGQARSIGFTNREGLAVVQTFFPLETNNRISVVACLFDDKDVCSSQVELKISRLDAETSFRWQNDHNIGDQNYQLNGKTQTAAPILESDIDYSLRSRLVWSAINGHDARLSVFGEGGTSFASDNPLLYPKLATNDFHPANLSVGADAAFWNTLLIAGEYAPVIGKTDGYFNSSGFLAHQVHDKLVVYGGFETSLTSAAAANTHVGRSLGPAAAVSFWMPSRVHSVTLIGAWEISQGSSFPSTNVTKPGTIALPASRTPEVSLQYTFYSGGRFSMTSGLSAGGFGAIPHYGMFMEVTARHLLRVK